MLPGEYSVFFGPTACVVFFEDNSPFRIMFPTDTSSLPLPRSPVPGVIPPELGGLDILEELTLVSNKLQGKHSRSSLPNAFIHERDCTSAVRVVHRVSACSQQQS